MEVRLEGTISGGGKSAIAVIPSVGSGRYAPGPNIAVSSVLACGGQHYTTHALQEPYQTRWLRYSLSVHTICDHHFPGGMWSTGVSSKRSATWQNNHSWSRW